MWSARLGVNMKQLRLFITLVALCAGMGQVSASVLDKVFENLTLPTGIHKAAADGKSKRIRELIGQGIDVNLQDVNGDTPLHHALQGRDKFITVRTLLDRKANVLLKNNDGNTPLHYASSPIVAKLLLDRGADINAQNNAGITILHVAVVRGKPLLVKKLLDEGARTNIADNNDITPLHLATAISYLKNDDALKGLLDPAISETEVKKTLVGAAIAGSSALIALGQIIKWLEVEYLRSAFKKRGREVTHKKIVEALKARKGTGKRRYLWRTKIAKVATVIILALLAVIVVVDMWVRNEILDSLLDHEANPNAQDKAGNTPLHTLADGSLIKPGNRRGGVLMAKHLIHKGANPLIKNNAGQLPYDLAKEHKRFSLYGTLRPGKVRKRQERKEKWKQFKGKVGRRFKGEHEAV